MACERVCAGPEPEGCNKPESWPLLTEQYEYTNVRPVTYIDGYIHVEFDVITARDALIRFSCRKTPSKRDPVYEIVLGGSTNTCLYVRRLQQTDTVKLVEIRDLVSAYNPHGFWIQISKSGEILVGKRGLTAPHVLTVWNDPNPLDIKYISFSSYYGVWAIWYNYVEKVPKSRDYGCISTNYNYGYEEFIDVTYQNTGKSDEIFIEFSVKTLRDGHLLLTPEKDPQYDDPVYELVLGGNTNTSLFFRRSMEEPNVISKGIKDLVGDEWKDYWIRVKKTGEIEFGKQLSEEKIFTWKDPEPLNIRYLSFSGWIGVGGLWTYNYGFSISK